MSPSEDLFQQRVEELEAGQPLADCLAGLSEGEAEMLQLVASLRNLPYPVQSPTTVAAQRAHLMSLGTKEINMNQQSDSTFLTRIQAALSTFVMQRQLATGLALAAIAVLVIFTWMNMSRLDAPESEEALVAAVTPATEVTTDPADTADSTDNIQSTAVPTQQVVAAVPQPEENSSDSTDSAAGSPSYELFLPNVARSLTLNARTAVIQDINGRIEVQAGDGSWSAVNEVGTLSAGQRVRTGKLSSATLVFYDGSQTLVGAESELSIDQLNAQKPEEGFRTVVMTQWQGESEHEVAFRDDGGSRYEVNTPAGSGIARGTKFHVIVTPNLLAHFIVTEGKVDVSNLNKVVSITAGQLSTLLVGNVPSEPFFNINGQGQVSQIGGTWTIAGQTFQTTEHTIIVGNPQVGDLVRVQGHLLADGNRVADLIVLLQQAPTNRFTLTGNVATMGATSWTVATQAIVVNAATLIDNDIVVGDEVRVEGIIAADGSLIAQYITLVQPPQGYPFHFAGIVQSVNADRWVVSGQTIYILGNTQIVDNPSVGDVVSVNGRVIDNRWEASTIRLLDSAEPEFSFTGIVNSTAPWVVAGIGFTTEAWTVIVPGIAVGDNVTVRGVILPDGTWVATSIRLVEPPAEQVIAIVGTVNSINPWIINGLPVVVDGGTNIIGNVVVGSIVQVRIELLPDGTWHVLSIRPVFTSFGLGCFQINSPVISLVGRKLSLKHWPALQLANNVNIHGQIKANSVVLLPLCFQFDGTVIILGDIMVIYQPVVVIINNGNSGGNSGGGSNKSNKSSKGHKRS